MKRIANIAVDIETLSRRPTAAIISIAAKVFFLDTDGMAGDENMKFFQAIDATSCAMYGFDIDPGTVDWWSRKPDDVKEQFKNTVPIKEALEGLAQFIERVKSLLNAEEVHVWCQGTDFDISILRNAYAVVFNDREEKHLPWVYGHARDSRTFINEGLRLLSPDGIDPKTIIPEFKGKKHDAMSDCDCLIHNVKWVNNQLNKLIKSL